jgi:hypothetical protein
MASQIAFCEQAGDARCEDLNVVSQVSPSATYSHVKPVGLPEEICDTAK